MHQERTIFLFEIFIIKMLQKSFDWFKVSDPKHFAFLNGFGNPAHMEYIYKLRLHCKT